MSGFLSNSWRDALAILSVAGVAATFIGILLTKSAARAAHDATESTLKGVKSSFGQFIVATAKRQLSEAKISVDNRDWRGAAIRSAELAEHMSQMAQVFQSEAVEWHDYAAKFRDFEASWRAHLESGPKPGTLTKWKRLSLDVAVRLDRQHGPPMGRPKG